VTDLSTDTFLLLFSVFIAVLLFAWWRRRRADPPGVTSRVMEARLQSFDPYEIAYLRGSVEEVGRVAVVSLVTRGYLKLDKQITATHMDRGVSADITADRVDDIVLDWFATPQPARQVSWGRLARRLEVVTPPYYERLLADGLLAPDNARQRVQTVAGLLLTVIGSSAWFLGTDLVRSGRTGMLLLLALAGLTGLGLLILAPRVTDRGHRLFRTLCALHKSGTLAAAADLPPDAVTAALFGVGRLSIEFRVLSSD
jgi:uncharacterized protein (TIGR04222 family)